MTQLNNSPFLESTVHLKKSSQPYWFHVTGSFNLAPMGLRLKQTFVLAVWFYIRTERNTQIFSTRHNSGDWNKNIVLSAVWYATESIFAIVHK